MGIKLNLRLPFLSIVIPVFNEEDNLRLLTSELTSVLQSLNKPWELLFIDDGSTDGRVEVLKELQEHSPRVKVITFNKNWGQTAAFDAEKRL